MRRERFFITMLSAFLMLLFAVFALLLLERGTELGLSMVERKMKLRAELELDKTRDEIETELNEEIVQKAGEIFDEVLAQTPGYDPSTEALAEGKYLSLLGDYVKNRFSDPERALSESVNRINGREANTVSIGGDGVRKVRLEDPDSIRLNIKTDAGDHITDSYLENVKLILYRDFKEAARQSCSILLKVPEARFYSANDIIFDHSMLAVKGIYFTGRTSSVVGNVYAGTHEISEFRQADARYGEREIFGGINVLSTQLGVEADTVLTEGDINVRDSFVMFGLDSAEVKLYAHAINRLDGFGSRNNVLVKGEQILDPGDEGYKSLVSSIKQGLSGLSGLSDYYDSDNDASYKGTYRKILSNYDVIISGDFKGAIVTSGNVIIEADSSVEGIIIAGDRIYARGNNSIVSDSDIIRVIVDEELIDEKALDPESLNDEFRISHYLKDYIGGIRLKGINNN